MDDRKQAFEEVADWCERYLEHQRGREIGMQFAAAIRLCGQLATRRPKSDQDANAKEKAELSARVDAVLSDFCRRFAEGAS